MANEERKRENIERVLSAAFELFMERGIEAVTQADICRISCVSAASINRYFTDRTDMVIQAAEYVYRKQMVESHKEDMLILAAGEHSGVELLEMYMCRIKDDFLNHPKLFALRAEYELYLFRHGELVEQDMSRMAEAYGFRPVLRQIFEIGLQDGTLPEDIDIWEKTRDFCDRYFGFLSSVSIHMQDLEDAKRRIDRYIQRVLKLYRQA